MSKGTMTPARVSSGRPISEGVGLMKLVSAGTEIVDNPTATS
jgi:hypothetical protein